MTEPPISPPPDTSTGDPTSEPRPWRSHTPWGSMATGLILVLVGLAWLLQTIGALEVPWGALIPGALIVVGIMTMIAARGGHAGGLIGLGIVLTILSVVTAGLRVPLRGGVGERNESPASAAGLRDRYELAIGKMELDLTDLDLSTGTTVVDASVGIGELVIELPEGTAARVEAEASLGNAEVLTRQESGFGPDVLLIDEGYDTASTRLSITISVGLGNIRVDR